MADERPDRGKPPPSGIGDAAKAWQGSQPYFDAVWQLVGGVGVGVGGGYGLDRWLHTTPWPLVAGSVLGMAGGFIGFFRTITQASRRK